MYKSFFNIIYFNLKNILINFYNNLYFFYLKFNQNTLINLFLAFL